MNGTRTMGAMARLRRIGVLGLLAALLLAGVPATAATAHALRVTGQVGAPASYTAADLAALGESTFPITDPAPGAPRTVTGTSLYDLVVRSAPSTPPGKNTALRVSVRITGAQGGGTTFALGELDPGFGAHPAVLAATPRHGIALVVPGDRDRRRGVADVATVAVSVTAVGVPVVPEGAVQVVSARRSVTLPGWLLTVLSTRTREVTFQSGTETQTHRETGVPLSVVLLAAGVLPVPDTRVTAVAADGYAATVTLGEEYVGGRVLLLSTVEDGVGLTRPRLVADGDVKGGRYVSAVVSLMIG